MAKRKLTEQDFKENPDLFNKHHFVIGDEVDLDALNKGNDTVKVGNAAQTGQGNDQNDNDDFENNDDTGGSAPPPGKGRG
jgi:hypothetical protein